MANYKWGVILSIALLFSLIVINDQLYGNVMNLSMPIMLLVLHVLIFKYLVPEKRYIAYSGFLLVLAAAIYFSFPALTQQQAQYKAVGRYNLEQVEATTVPIDSTNSWNPFKLHHAYFFYGISRTAGEIFLLVNAENGKVILSEPYEEVDEES